MLENIIIMLVLLLIVLILSFYILLFFKFFNYLEEIVGKYKIPEKKNYQELLAELTKMEDFYEKVPIEGENKNGRKMDTESDKTSGQTEELG